MDLKKEEIEKFQEEYNKITYQYVKVLSDYGPIKLKSTEAI